MMKIFNYQFSMINPKIFSFVFVSLFIFVISLSMVSMVNAQAPDRDIPAGSETMSDVNSDERNSRSPSDERNSKGDSDERNSNAPKDSGIFTLSNPLKVNSIGELLHSLVQVFTYLVILFAVIMFVYLGFQYVAFAAQGNSGKIGELHTKFMWLVAGVAIVIGARVIIEVIINTLSATGAVSPDVIQSAQNVLKK